MQAQVGSNLRRTVFAALWFLPILVAVYLVWQHCVSLPFWDEWQTPGAQLASWYRGTLTWGDLWSQHNESRKLFPRLVYLPLFLVVGWDVRLTIAFVLIVVCLGSLGLYCLARQTIRGAGAASLAFAVINLLLFSPRQYDNFLFGIQWETFAPGVALIFAMLINLSKLSFCRKTIWNGALALVSTYTFANGMLLWLLAFPLNTGSDAPASTRSKIACRLIYIGAAIAAIGCYFINYQHPAFSPPRASLLNDATPLFHFFCIWLGSVFRIASSTAAGVVVLGLFLFLAAISIWLTANDRRWQPHYPWMVLGAYTLISGAATAIARVGFGFTMAADPRYVVFSVMLYIAIVGLGFTIYEKIWNRGNLRRACQFFGAIAVLVILALWASTFTAERRSLKKFTEYRTHLQWILRWADAVPQNPELVWLSPYPETPQVIQTLHEHDALRPRRVSETVTRAITEPPGGGNPSTGVLERAVADGSGRLWVKGWALAADCVVIGLQTPGRWEPRWVVETSARSPANNQDTFSRPLLIGDISGNAPTIKAWAIDLKTDRAFPLAGEIALQP
ncbi:MAG TPA: hypothetical protein VH188_09345 [Chthoniobacterales bacterium]|nr:hypothetical protein [Chthoniobacterales bacterium]